MLVVLVAEQAAQAAGGSGGLMGAFKEKPTFLVANLVVSAVVIAMVIERIAFQLSKYSVNSKEFFAQIKKLVSAGNIDRAIKLCDAGDYPTLLGLLGTVTGLITTFNAVSDPRLSAAQRQAQLSLGISEAMYNTAFGLGIAVTCMIAHLFLHQRAKSIQHDLDATQERVFNLLTIQTRPGGY